MNVDMSYAKSQALIMKRIANGMKRGALKTGNETMLDWADHLQTEASYLMDALGMEKDER